MDKKAEVLEELQISTAKFLATNPAGHKLCLVGGFRYRLLDQSARRSMDIDYHWEGDLDQKQAELVEACRRRLLPLIAREFGYQGGVQPHQGSDAESPTVRTVDLAFWQPGVEHSRVEIPVEVTRLCRLDATIVRTADGVVYPTLSDPDVIEGKITALFNRPVLEHRDLVDIFLFSNRLLPESPRRLMRKFNSLSISRTSVNERLGDLEKNAAYHVRALAAVIGSQLDPAAAANIQSGGGAAAVHRAVRLTVQRLWEEGGGP
jgi:hypothetical protein